MYAPLYIKISWKHLEIMIGAVCLTYVYILNISFMITAWVVKPHDILEEINMISMVVGNHKRLLLN